MEQFLIQEHPSVKGYDIIGNFNHSLKILARNGWSEEGIVAMPWKNFFIADYNIDGEIVPYYYCAKEMESNALRDWPAEIMLEAIVAHNTERNIGILLKAVHTLNGHELVNTFIPEAEKAA